MKKRKATFGMGCFWSPELLFSKTPGILSTQVGFMGGDEKAFPSPSYEEVCSGKTNHAEVVHIIYDEDKIKYENLLEIFWKNHNPTTKNRQDLDIGSQYRSVIFYHTESQKKKAVSSKEKIQKQLMAKKTIFKRKIVTEIKKAGTFYPAEEHHQKYLEKKGKTTC